MVWPVACVYVSARNTPKANLEGEVDHRDGYLFPEDHLTNKKKMAYVSRSCQQRLILDR